MTKTSNEAKSNDESAAFAAFTQTLSQTPRSGVMSATSKRRTLKGWPTLIVSSLVIGGFAAAGELGADALSAGDLAARGYGWESSFKIGAAAIIGGPFGACLAMAAAMLLALRMTNRRVTDMGETGTYNDMPSFLVPVVWAGGYAGAIVGSAIFAGIAVHLVTSDPNPQLPFRPAALGGAVGAVLCALVVGGIAVLKAIMAPRNRDQIRER